MTQAQLTKLWTVIGALVVFLAVNHWSVKQGGPALFKAVALDERPLIAAYFAIPVVALLLALTAVWADLAPSNGSYWTRHALAF